eukprot:4142715-Amphidinium_carterae.1
MHPNNMKAACQAMHTVEYPPVGSAVCCGLECSPGVGCSGIRPRKQGDEGLDGGMHFTLWGKNVMCMGVDSGLILAICETGQSIFRLAAGTSVHTVPKSVLLCSLHFLWLATHGASSEARQGISRTCWMECPAAHP